MRDDVAAAECKCMVVKPARGADWGRRRRRRRRRPSW
jgi:hypothetical protein